MSIPSRFLTPHNQVSSDFVHSLGPYLKALRLAVCGTQCSRLQLATAWGACLICSTRQAAVAYRASTAPMASTAAHVLVFRIFMTQTSDCRTRFARSTEFKIRPVAATCQLFLDQRSLSQAR
ncbi:conserved hypothetical protein, partial [Ricinus communis]